MDKVITKSPIIQKLYCQPVEEKYDNERKPVQNVLGLKKPKSNHITSS